MPGPGLPLFDLIEAGLLACPPGDAFPPGRAVAENVTGDENRHASRLPWTYSYGHSSGFAPDSLFKAGGDMFRSAHLDHGAKIVINPHICNKTNEKRGLANVFCQTPFVLMPCADVICNMFRASGNIPCAKAGRSEASESNGSRQGR